METIILTTATLAIAFIALALSIVATIKSVQNEKDIEPLYDAFRDVDELIDKIIDTLKDCTKTETKHVKGVATVDSDGNVVLPEEMGEQLPKEVVEIIKAHIAAHYKATKDAETTQISQEAKKTDKLPSDEKETNSGKKNAVSAKVKKYDEQFKNEVRDFAKKNPDASVNTIARYFKIGKNTAKRWLNK